MILETERLRLRPLDLSDAPTIQVLATPPEIAMFTLNMPSPYPEGGAEQYIRSRIEQADKGYVFGIVRKADQQLMGMIGLHPDGKFQRAEMGYWIGVPYWNQGYMSEAARRVIAFGFSETDLNRIYAGFFSPNIASRRVMENAGMTYEGMLRQHVQRFGTFYDLGYCGILRAEWEAAQA